MMKSSRGGKTIGTGTWWSLGLPLVFFLCLVFFLAGFFGFALFSQQVLSTLGFVLVLCSLFVRYCYYYYYYLIIDCCCWNDSWITYVQDEWSDRPRSLEAVGDAVEEERSFDPMPHGKSGEASFNSIPFQVSAYLHFVYFSNYISILLSLNFTRQHGIFSFPFSSENVLIGS